MFVLLYLLSNIEITFYIPYTDILILLFKYYKT